MSTGTESMASTARRWRSQLGQVAAIVAIVLVGKGALAEPFYVPSGSMEPTLLIGDALLASKYPYGYSSASLPIHLAFPETSRVFGATPNRGDVVVFRWPGDRSQVWVKRVIGLPGDRVQLRQGLIFINGVAAGVKPDGIGEAEGDNGAGETAQRFVETLPGGVSHEIFKLYDHGRLDNTPEVTVPQDHLFVMGDNRDNSDDSRYWGFVPDDHIRGKAFFIWFNWDDISNLAFKRVGSGIR